MNKNIIILLLLWLIPAAVNSQVTTGTFDHQPYDSLLKKYVGKNGLVDYRGIKNNPGLLDQYLKQLEQLDPAVFEGWQRPQKMAFWINAYNAITIAGIVENYPIEYGNLIARARFPKNSIRQIGGFWDNVFVRVMGQDITLNQIEHEILRKKYEDPRIHAVLVCAAIGCPLLEDRAFFPQNLDARLEKANRDFINNPEKVTLDTLNNLLYLSSIFDWYKEDYPVSPESNQSLKNLDEDLRGVVEFILRYIDDSEAEFIRQNSPQIKFLDYDWTLNDQ